MKSGGIGANPDTGQWQVGSLRVGCLVPWAYVCGWVVGVIFATQVGIDPSFARSAQSTE